MKRYISLFVVLAFMFSVSYAKAQDTATSTASRPTPDALKAKRAEFLNELKAKREAFRNEVEAQKSEFKNARANKKSEFRGKAQEMIGQRFEVAVRNLETAQNRVEGVIQKLNAAGRDTASATESLNLSKTKLEAAKAKIAEVKALIPTTDEKVTAEAFAQIKLGAREAKDLLKESHQALVEAVKTLKGQKTE